MKFESRPVLEDISIVIPTLGREILEQSLCWILAGSTWPGCLIVVERGTNPDVVGLLKRVREIGVRVKHIVSSQRGRSAGINCGLEQVDTRFVAITDDDCVVAKDYLRQSPGAVITGRVEDADDLRRGDDVLREAIQQSYTGTGVEPRSPNTLGQGGDEILALENQKRLQTNKV